MLFRSKSTQIAAALAGEGLLVSNEPVPSRAKILSRNIERMGVPNALVVSAQPEALAARWGVLFDAVLVDAPCSGLGILAKKPDIRYKTLEKARHDELLATQSAILDTAAAHLKEGGRLVYSTCTIDPAENEEQVRAFVGRHPEFRVVTPDVRFPAGMTVGDWGALSVPTRTGMDGFFLCAMQKRDS